MAQSVSCSTRATSPLFLRPPESVNVNSVTQISDATTHVVNNIMRLIHIAKAYKKFDVVIINRINESSEATC